VALLLNPLPPGAADYRKAVESAAKNVGVSLHVVEVRGRDELEAAFAALARERVDAVVVQGDPVFFTARRQVVDLAMKHRLPAVFHAGEFVELGGLMSYGGSLEHQFRRAAAYVDKILRGARPGDLAVESAKIDLRSTEDRSRARPDVSEGPAAARRPGDRIAGRERQFAAGRFARPTTMSFSDKVIVITGASEGIGAELARQLAPEKPKLVLAAAGRHPGARRAREARVVVARPIG
jgi:3-oxoacyl-ACP reductase-like protein